MVQKSIVRKEMKDKLFVSIVTPSYNQDRFTEDRLVSVHENTLADTKRIRRLLGINPIDLEEWLKRYLQEVIK